MPTFYITRELATPDRRLDDMGVNVDIEVTLGEPDSATDDVPARNLSSSSSTETAEVPVSQLPSSSSSTGAGSSTAIFLFRRIAGEDYFLGLASPPDIATWPIETPGSEGYFRDNKVELTFRSEALMKLAWAEMLKQIQQLATALKNLAILEVSEEIDYDFSRIGTRARASSSSSSRGVGRRIYMSRAAVVPYPSGSPVGYRMTVTADADGGDKKIFLHRDDQPDRSRVIQCRPIAVCSPGDMVDYPADTADEDQFPQFYRKETFDIVSSDVGLLKDTWDKIKLDTESLAAALKHHQDIVDSIDTDSVSY